MLPSTLYIMWPIHGQSLKFLRLMIEEEIHLQETWQTDRQIDGPFLIQIDILFFSKEKEMSLSV